MIKAGVAAGAGLAVVVGCAAGTVQIRTSPTSRSQTDSWDGIEVSWSYHPDDELDVVLELD